MICRRRFTRSLQQTLSWY